MLSKAILYLSEQKSLQKLVVTNGLARNVSRRFVAGETLADAIEAVRVLNQRNFTATLNNLGEHVTTLAEAEQVALEYQKMLDTLHQEKSNCNISIKLSQLGFDVDPAACRQFMFNLLERARRYGTFVRIDMEGSDYTDKTLALLRELHQTYENVGIVIQAYLYRSEQDIAQLNKAGVRVRLCKGAYKEPSTVAYPEKADVDRNYIHLMEQLLKHGNYPGLATHDEAMINRAIAYSRAEGIDPSRFEFQMLYGIRRDLQEKLLSEGFRVRVYVPYGSQWYPYLMRRMAERPANLLFVLRNMIRG